MTFDLLDGLEDEAPIVEQKPVYSLAEQKSVELDKITDELLAQCQNVLSDTLHFADLTGEEQEPPAEWVHELGKRDAWRRFRLARAAWLNRSEAPVGFELARSTAQGILNAKKQRPEEMSRVLNVNLINMPPPPALARMILPEKKR